MPVKRDGAAPEVEADDVPSVNPDRGTHGYSVMPGSRDVVRCATHQSVVVSMQVSPCLNVKNENRFIGSQKSRFLLLFFGSIERTVS